MWKLSSCEVLGHSANAPKAKNLRIRSISRSSHLTDAGSSWSGAMVIFSPYICVISHKYGGVAQRQSNGLLNRGSRYRNSPSPPKVRKNLNPSAKDVKGEAFRYMPKVVGDWKYDARYHSKTKRTSLHCCGQWKEPARGFSYVVSRII